jgi:hypothetical protein
MPLSHRLRAFAVVFLASLLGSAAFAGGRLDGIVARDHLVCGVAHHDPGFAQRTAEQEFRGFEVDLCKALAAAVLGSAQKLRFRPIDTVHEYLADAGIDIVFHRLSWTLTREAPGQLEFGPVYFFETNGAALEPLAPMLRSDDADFSRIVRWVVYALVDAEMHGVSSANATEVDVISRWPSVETAGSLGLTTGWANRMVKQTGNYQQIFDRNLGRQSPTQMVRGPNRLWRDGGLLLTPLLR